MRALELARLLSSSGASDFSNHDIQVSIQKVFPVKADISDNAKPVCHDAEFKGITEMSVDVHLLDSRISGGMRRHRAVGSFIRVERII